jgi:hypothetical protein
MPCPDKTQKLHNSSPLGDKYQGSEENTHEQTISLDFVAKTETSLS